MLPYSLAVAASAIYFRISVVLVTLLAGAKQQGYFAASFRIVEVLTAVPLLHVSPAFPISANAAHGGQKRRGYAAGRVLEVALLGGAGTAVSLGVGADLATRVIGGAEFKGADNLLAVQGVALAAMFVTSSVLMMAMDSVWTRWKNTDWKQTIAKGLAPVIVGLVWSSVFTIGKGVAHGTAAYVIAAVVTLLMLCTKISAPALILLSGAAGIVVLR